MNRLYRFVLLIVAVVFLFSVTACSLSGGAGKPVETTPGATPEGALPTDSASTLAPPEKRVPIESIEVAGEITTSDAAVPLVYSVSVPKLDDSRARDLNGNYTETQRYYKEDYAPMLAKDSEYISGGVTDVHTLALAYDYQVKYNNGDIVSLLFRESVQVGDLYSEIYSAQTYSLDVGRLLTLHDVIQSEESPYQMAAREIARQIEADRQGENVWGFYSDVDENMIAMYISDYSFYLNDEGKVVLIVNPSFISDCTSGLCEFPLIAE